MKITTELELSKAEIETALLNYIKTTAGMDARLVSVNVTNGDVVSASFISEQEAPVKKPAKQTKNPETKRKTMDTTL